MPSLLEFLEFEEEILEEASAPKARITHVEEEILNTGKKGAMDAIDSLADFAKILHQKGRSDQYEVTEKWDGSPALFCGYEPGTRDFFISTGKFLAKKPVMFKTEQDVYDAYPDGKKNRQGQPIDHKSLRFKLNAALKYLKQVVPEGMILKGDLMFLEGPEGMGVSKHYTMIDGEKHIEFKPNTLKYAVPISSKKTYDRIDRAKLGIVFHTKYVQRDKNQLMSVTNLTGDHNIKALINTMRTKSNSLDVWFDDAYYLDETGSVTLNNSEFKQIMQHVTGAKKTLAKIDDDVLNNFLANNKYAAGLISKHLNSRIKDIDSPSHIQDIEDHLSHYVMYGEQDIDTKYKNETTKAKKKEEIRINMHLIKMIFHVIKETNDAKMALIRTLNKVTRNKHFAVDTNGDYVVTAPEGYVCIKQYSQDDNKLVIKLVDRLQFSRFNFAGH